MSSVAQETEKMLRKFVTQCNAARTRAQVE